MIAWLTRVWVLRTAVVLTVIFNVLALVVLVWRDNPIAFTVFMFIAQPLFVVALLLFLGALVVDLRTRKVL